ncbi:MAG: DUF3419 family protein [Chitinophagales bacterium]|nr:DUF3419 family protein [Chitinophagales bacterium]
MLYYTHVNEDNAVERKAMAGMHVTELFVIAGSGERVLALLDHPGLSKVYVVDNNREALYLCALKIAALKSLDVQSYLRFIGVLETSAEERLQCFAQLAPELAEECLEYWVGKRADLTAGVCNAGHFERFLANARPLLRFFLGKDFYQCLEKSRAEWQHFPHMRWAIVRWLFARRDDADGCATHLPAGRGIGVAAQHVHAHGLAIPSCRAFNFSGGKLGGRLSDSSNPSGRAPTAARSLILTTTVIQPMCSGSE